MCRSIYINFSNSHATRAHGDRDALSASTHTGHARTRARKNNCSPTDVQFGRDTRSALRKVRNERVASRTTSVSRACGTIIHTFGWSVCRWGTEERGSSFPATISSIEVLTLPRVAQLNIWERARIYFQTYLIVRSRGVAVRNREVNVVQSNGKKICIYCGQTRYTKLSAIPQMEHEFKTRK